MIFTFLVLTYNHENYILQNLESIKYQIINFGQEYDFQLIIADDASIDKTLDLATYWISLNKGLFVFTDVSSNDINQGTCKNLIKGIRLIKGDRIKLMAGDDIFAAENIFEFVSYLEEYDLVMGLHIPFMNETVNYSKATKKTIMHQIAAELFFEKESFNKRIRRSAFLHAPSVFFNKKLVQNEKVIEFVNEFSVIDDHSMWLKMAAENDNLKYKFVPKFAVLYRRTADSIYIVKRTDFHNDRIRLFMFVIKTDKSILNKIIQYNKMFCFKSDSIIVKKYLDIGNYEVKAALFLRWKETNEIIEDLEPDIELNRKYLKKLVQFAKEVLYTKNK